MAAMDLLGRRWSLRILWELRDGPVGARALLERCDGLSSSVLYERATIKGGAVEQSNFHDYHVLRMADMPEEMHVAFVERDAPPSGLGEIGNPWVAGAVANAFHKLTGKRLYHMPFTPARVQQALKT